MERGLDSRLSDPNIPVIDDWLSSCISNNYIRGIRDWGIGN